MRDQKADGRVRKWRPAELSSGSASIIPPKRPKAFNVPILRFGEIKRRGAIQLRFAHIRRSPFVLADGKNDVAHIGWVAGPKLGAALPEAKFAQVFGAIWFTRDVEAG